MRRFLPLILLCFVAACGANTGPVTAPPPAALLATPQPDPGTITVADTLERMSVDGKDRLIGFLLRGRVPSSGTFVDSIRVDLSLDIALGNCVPGDFEGGWFGPGGLKVVDRLHPDAITPVIAGPKSGPLDFASAIAPAPSSANEATWATQSTPIRPLGDFEGWITIAIPVPAGPLPCAFDMSGTVEAKSGNLTATAGIPPRRIDTRDALDGSPNNVNWRALVTFFAEEQKLGAVSASDIYQWKTQLPAPADKSIEHWRTALKVLADAASANWKALYEQRPPEEVCYFGVWSADYRFWGDAQLTFSGLGSELDAQPLSGVVAYARSFVEFPPTDALKQAARAARSACQAVAPGG